MKYCDIIRRVFRGISPMFTDNQQSTLRLDIICLGKLGGYSLAIFGNIIYEIGKNSCSYTLVVHSTFSRCEQELYWQHGILKERPLILE